jgi:hypothetical protein
MKKPAAMASSGPGTNRAARVSSMWRNAIRLVWSAAFALCYAAYADPARQPVPAASAASAAARHRVPGPGFAPDAETMFAFVVTLVPPGPDRARRAIAILDRQLAFQRRVTFYPVFAPTLQKVVDQLPPRESTLIRAAELYSKTDIPWEALPDGTRDEFRP